MKLEQLEQELQDLHLVQQNGLNSDILAKSKYQNVLKRLTFEVQQLEGNTELPQDLEGETAKALSLSASTQREIDVLRKKQAARKSVKTGAAVDAGSCDASKAAVQVRMSEKQQKLSVGSVQV